MTRRSTSLLLTSLVFVIALTGLVATAFDASGAEGDWGTIKGRIIWGDDKLPALGPLKLPDGNPAVPQCLQANNGKPPPNEMWVINPKDKGIKNTFVWLVDSEGPKANKALPIKPELQKIKNAKIVLDQPACHFIPHALGVREGQVLEVKNSAAFAHNFKWSGDPLTKNQGNVLMPPGGDPMAIALQASRRPVKFECNIHPWMTGWVWVYNHPYFAVTDDSGAFEIKDAPAGKLRLMVWHGSAGWKGGADGRNGEPIVIKAGAVSDLGAIAFPPPKD